MIRIKNDANAVGVSTPERCEKVDVTGIKYSPSEERKEHGHMRQFQEDVVINRPVEIVFVHLTDLSHPEAWAVFHSEDFTIQMDESKSEVVHQQMHTPPVHVVTEGPLRVGTTLVQSSESSSQPMSAVIEVTAYEPPRIFGLKQTSDLGINYLSYKLQSESNGTHLIVRIEMEPSASMITIVDQFAPMIEPQLQQSMLDLKKQLESNAA